MQKSNFVLAWSGLAGAAAADRKYTLGSVGLSVAEKCGVMTMNVNKNVTKRTGMYVLRIVAVLLALCLMVGEVWRSWGMGRPVMFVLDDQLMGGFLIAAAWTVRVETVRTRAAFAAAWGMVSGMLYTSFFGKLFAPTAAQAGNWDLGVLTALLGIAFAVSLLGVWFSMTLPSQADN